MLGGVERAKKNITLINLIKVADALEVPIIDLFSYTRHQKSILNEKDIMLNQLVDILMGLKKSDLRKVQLFYRYESRSGVGSKIGGRYELHTDSITDEIKILIDKYVFAIKEEWVNKEIIKWIQDQWTYRFCLIFFYECLKYANDILQFGKRHNNWDKVLMNTKANFKIAFRCQENKYKRDESINIKMYYEYTNLTKSTEHQLSNEHELFFCG